MAKLDLFCWLVSWATGSKIARTLAKDRNQARKILRNLNFLFNKISFFDLRPLTLGPLALHTNFDMLIPGDHLQFTSIGHFGSWEFYPPPHPNKNVRTRNKIRFAIFKKKHSYVPFPPPHPHFHTNFDSWDTRELSSSYTRIILKPNTKNTPKSEFPAQQELFTNTQFRIILCFMRSSSPHAWGYTLILVK